MYWSIVMKVDEQFRIVMYLALTITGAIAAASVFLYANFLMGFMTFLLMILLISTFDMVAQMKCHDPMVLYQKSVAAQREILAWYVNNAMHEFKSPAYYEIVVAALYDKGKTFITDLAMLLEIAENESRKVLAKEIQNQIEEWELIVQHLRERINHLQSMRRH
jgi:hypothetical protein